LGSATSHPHLSPFTLTLTPSPLTPHQLRLDPECVPRLRVLEAADNKIAQWPEDVGGLTELHTLNLANNGLKSLAGTELVAMKRMWMPKRGVHELLGLSILHLPHNEMSELPPTLVSCLLPWLALTLTLTLTSC